MTIVPTGIVVGGICLCFGAQAAVTVTVSPATVSVAPLHTRQFSAHVDGSSDTDVTWLVEGIVGGAPAVGFISPAGIYTAPADVGAAKTVHIEAEAVVAASVYGSAEASLTASPPNASQFYVSTSGSDTGNGSAAHPWRTIQHALNRIPAGGAIEVAGGVYNELVTLTRSGSEAAGFTTLEAASGATPIIDGTGLGIPNGENGLVTLNSVSFVRVRGFEIRNYVSHSAALDPVGILVEGAGRHIELTNNHVHDITTTVTSSAGDALGIAVYGTASPTSLGDLLIADNELDHLTTGFSESMALSGNVEQWQATGNSIHDNDNIGIDVGGFEGFAPDPAYDRARSGYVAQNTVWNITSLHNPAYQGDQSADGIYVDGGIGVLIERNLVHDTDFGIEAASEHAGHASVDVTIRSNIVYRSNVGGITIGGYAASVGGSRHIVIVNNTLVDNDTTQSGTGEFQIQYHGAGNVFTNNIADANAQGLLVNAFVPTSPPPATLSFNRYASPLGAANSQFTWQNKNYTGFASYLRGAATDQRSTFGDPMFVDAAAENYRLAANSPAIGAGTVMGLSVVGLYDFAGSPRVTNGKIDQGAYQH